MSYDFSTIENDSITRPKDTAWGNFAKFDNVGDKVAGSIVDVFYQAEKNGYKAARGITLKQPDGTLVNVQIKRWQTNLDATNRLHLGDPLMVKFVETKKSNFPNPTKIFQFFGKELPENAANKTVAELETADMNTQAIPTQEDEVDQMAAEASQVPA